MDQFFQEQMIKIAISAPSGDNCQPFEFLWRGDVLEIYHNAERALSRKYNFHNLGSLLGIGTTLGLITLGARALGKKAVIEMTEFLSKDSNPSQAWVKIRFLEDSSGHKNEEELKNIFKRHVNREVYRGGDLDEKLKSDILSQLQFNHQMTKEMSVEFVPFKQMDPGILKSLLDALSYSENCVLQDKIILEEVGKWVRLTRRSAEKSKDGMHWSQINMKVFDVPFLFLIKKVPGLIQWLYAKVIGIVFRKKTKDIISSSAGLVVIWGAKPSVTNLVESGQIAINLWVQLNARNYGVQPVTSLSTLPSYLLSSGNHHLIDPLVMEKMKDGQYLLRRICGKEKDQWPLWILRTGIAQPLSKDKISLRRQPSNFIHARGES